MIVDAAGVVYEGNAPLAKLHAVANAPIFSYDESFFGNEIVGGPILLVEDTSKKAAAVAVRILGGENAGGINVPPVEFAKPRFDWRQLQRWNISESRLPAGSEIFFRELSAWERYRTQILMGCLVFLVQAGLISWLVYEHLRRQAAEIIVRNTMNQLAHVNRMATAGEMTASIAHEIRQPLTGIRLSGQAALNWLKRQTPDVEQAAAAMQNVVNQTHRVDDVIKNIRAMFKKEQTARKPLDVNELVEQVLVLTEQTIASERIAVATELKARSLVLGDEIQLQQVLINLVNNAIEAMSASRHWGRVLRLTTTAGADNTVLISVADSGPGIDPDIADTLFAPFVTTKAGGMGMGLSICKSVVEAHGGELTATPATPRGTTFQISLPGYNPSQ
jgi:signal transduction histidine kinase